MIHVAAPVANADDVARDLLALAADDGDLITNLKMQKLVYYAYAWTLIKNDRRLFDEPIQAWANGPVVPSLYQQLSKFGAGPIGEEFLGIETEEDFESLAARFPENVLETLNGVYEQYMRLSAFDLATLSHSEKPWQAARHGLGVTDRGGNPISDEDIVAQYSAS